MEIITSQTNPFVESRSNEINRVSFLEPTALTRNPHRFWKPIDLLIAFLTRISWHTRAYGTILGILLLTLISLIVLQTYEFCRSTLRRSVGTKAIALSSHDSVQ